MGGRFEYKFFREIDVADPFFDSLKRDYEGFETEWFPKCAMEGRQALVFSDEHGLGAFVAMKQENEPIQLKNGEYPATPRLKVCTLLLAERFRGQRLGEGAIGLVLWKWQALKLDEVYVTVYPTHADLISQLRKFGFIDVADAILTGSWCLSEVVRTSISAIPTNRSPSSIPSLQRADT